MYGSRNERARARARHLLAQIAPLPDDAEVQRLRELSMDYIREARKNRKRRCHHSGIQRTDFGRLRRDSPLFFCSRSSKREVRLTYSWVGNLTGPAIKR